MSAPDNGLVLYRFFDASGGLLYIGISVNVWARFSQHRQGSAFFPAVASVTLQSGFASMDELRAVEAAAIREEKPRFNVIHNRPKPKTRAQREAQREAAFARSRALTAECEAWVAASPENTREAWAMVERLDSLRRRA